MGSIFAPRLYPSPPKCGRRFGFAENGDSRVSCFIAPKGAYDILRISSAPAVEGVRLLHPADCKGNRRILRGGRCRKNRRNNQAITIPLLLFSVFVFTATWRPLSCQNGVFWSKPLSASANLLTYRLFLFASFAFSRLFSACRFCIFPPHFPHFCHTLSVFAFLSLCIVFILIPQTPLTFSCRNATIKSAQKRVSGRKTPRPPAMQNTET